MKRSISLILVLLAAVYSQAQLPDFEAKDINQNWVSLSDLKGEKLTVIDYWATWCKPCVTAIPKLNSLYEEFEALGVAFIGINVDGPRNQAKVKPFANSIGIKYPIILDPDQEMVNEFNINAFPTLIVYNKKGKEVFTHEGFNPGDEKLIRKELTKLLEE